MAAVPRVGGHSISPDERDERGGGGFDHVQRRLGRKTDGHGKHEKC